MNKIDINRLHTTELGIFRIQRNIKINEDIIDFCTKAVLNAKTDDINQRGKNWYVIYENCIITINAHSHTVITAHKLKSIKKDPR